MWPHGSFFGTDPPTPSTVMSSLQMMHESSNAVSSSVVASGNRSCRFAVTFRY
jgi:hypothetical protein